MKIDNETLVVLDSCRVEGNVLFLPPIQLERKLYEKINKCIESIGGKWNKSKKGHVFDNDPTDMLDNLINTGEIIDLKKEYQYFPTPEDIAKQMVELADIQPNELVLEPSAGQGAIAKFFPKQNPVHLVELNSQNIEVLDRLNQDGVFGCCTLYPGNFLEDERMIYNKIIMNPPFSKQQDIDHVLHAYNTCLKDGGRLVSIMSEGTFFRQNKKAVEFRKLLDEVGYSIELDEGAFKESGTMVRTRIVVMDK